VGGWALPGGMHRTNTRPDSQMAIDSNHGRPPIRTADRNVEATADGNSAASAAMAWSSYRRARRWKKSKKWGESCCETHSLDCSLGALPERTAFENKRCFSRRPSHAFQTCGRHPEQSAGSARAVSRPTCWSGEQGTATAIRCARTGVGWSLVKADRPRRKLRLPGRRTTEAARKRPRYA
jgi:hypothetical protein